LKATAKGFFTDHKTLLVLNKLHQYEQSSPKYKGTRIQLKSEKDPEKKLSDSTLVN